MLGASALDAGPLRGRRMLNLDSEDEGVFTVSCAGGATAVCTLPAVWEAAEGKGLCIRVRGLTGGHSGAEIHHGRASANQLLGVLLGELWEKRTVRLARAEGGRKDNAIPVTAEAEIVTDDPEAVMHLLFDVVTRLKERHQATDPNLTVDVVETSPARCLDAAATERAVRFLASAPFGAQTWSRDIPGLVQTSLNLGILRTEEDALTAAFSVRSSAAAEKSDLLDRLGALAARCGGSMAVEGDYPAWEYRPDSPLRQLCQEVFREQYGYEARIEAIHAGLECGILSGKLPGLDCVSLGPNLPDIHTPRERMEIASVQRVWAFLLEVLRRAK